MRLSAFDTAQVAGSGLGECGPAVPCVAALQPAGRGLARRGRVIVVVACGRWVGRFRAQNNDVFILSKMSNQNIWAAALRRKVCDALSATLHQKALCDRLQGFKLDNSARLYQIIRSV